MSRSRSRVIMSEISALKGKYVLPGYPTPFALPFPDRSDVIFNYKRSESMIDESSSTTRSQYNPVTHYSVYDAHIKDEVRITSTYGYYPPYYPYYNTDMYYDVRVRPTLASLYTDNTGLIDWASAISGLADQVNSLIRSKVLAGVSLLELAKTWRMVMNPFSLLKPGWRKAAGIHTAASLYKWGSNLWLENSYGWKPFFGDIENFAKASVRYQRETAILAQKSQARRLSNSVQSVLSCPNPTSTNSDVEAWKSSNKNNSYSLPLVRCVFSAPIVNARVTCMLQQHLLGPSREITRFLAIYGLEGASFFETLWELVPYSFVVDWFVNTKGIMDLARYTSASRTLQGQAVSKLGYSVKKMTSYRAELVPRWPTGYATLPSNITSFDPGILTSKVSGNISMYTRSLGVPPNETSVFVTKGLSLNQLASGAALFSRLVT